MTSLKKSFSLDLRSLGLFRILFGVVLLLDFVFRLEVLQMFYSDSGVLPRTSFIAEFVHPWTLSIYLMAGQSVFFYLLLSIHFFLIGAFLFGWRTKLITPLLWFFTLSLQERNWFVLSGADDIIKLILFVAIFLPLGLYYSLDSKKYSPQRPKRYFSMWSLAFLVQVSCIYFFTAFLKTGAPWLEDFTAIRNALSIDSFSTTLGIFIASNDWISKPLTVLTLVFEFLVTPLLLVSFIALRHSWKLRLAAVFLGVSFHLGLVFSMTLGLFPWICIVMWLALIPSKVWNYSFFKKLNQFLENRFRVRFFESNFLKKRYHFKEGLLKSAFALLFIFSIVYWNTVFLPQNKGENATLKIPKIEPILKLSRYMHWYQKWAMFAPYPMSHNRWMTIDAEFENGDKLEIFNDRSFGSKSFVDPSVPSSLDSYSKKYFSNLLSKPDDLLLHYSRYLCRLYNKEKAPNRLYTFDVYKIDQNTKDRKLGKDPRVKHLRNHRCFATKYRRNFQEKPVERLISSEKKQ